MIFILNRLTAMLSLQKVLLVVNAYNATYCFILWFINALTGNEPMASLRSVNEAITSLQFLKWVIVCSVYLFLQLFHIAILSGTKAETMKTVAIGNFFLIRLHWISLLYQSLVSMHGHPQRRARSRHFVHDDVRRWRIRVTCEILKKERSCFGIDHVWRG